MESLFGFWDTQSQRRRTGGGGSGFESLKRLGHISPAVQSHLKHVYLTLCSALAFSALGAYLHILLNVGGTLTTLGCLAAIAYLISLPASQAQERNRFALLMSAALLQGASVGPLVDLVIEFDPRSIYLSIINYYCDSFGLSTLLIPEKFQYLTLSSQASQQAFQYITMCTLLFLFSNCLFALFRAWVMTVGEIAIFVPELSPQAHFGPSTFKTSNLVLKNSRCGSISSIPSNYLPRVQESNAECRSCPSFHPLRASANIQFITWAWSSSMTE